MPIRQPSEDTEQDCKGLERLGLEILTVYGSFPSAAETGAGRALSPEMPECVEGRL